MKDRAKSDSRWVKGIYAGKTTQLDEHIALTEAGADTFRTVRRLPLGSQHQLVVLEQARGAPWNTVEGIEKAKPEGLRSKVDVRQLQEPILETEVTRGSGSASDIAPREREIPPVFVPAPKISGRSIDPDGPPEEKKTKKTRGAEEVTPDAGKHGDKKAKVRESVEKSSEQMEAEAERSPSTKRKAEHYRTHSESESSSSSGSASKEVAAPKAKKLPSPPGTAPSVVTQDMISNIAHGDVINAFDCCRENAVKERLGENHGLEKDLETVESTFETYLKREQASLQNIANVMDWTDSIMLEADDMKKARLDEIRKLEQTFKAFTVRDRRELPKDLTVFGHRWVDKVSEGICKARLTRQDFKKKQSPEERLSSEQGTNFCPTPSSVTCKIIEVYSLLHQFPRVKADLTSAFLIAKDGGDKQGQPVFMRPPKEWLEEYDTWILSQEKEIQEYLKDVPREELIWQVDGNIYGRQSAAAQYRDRPEEILTNKVSGRYRFKRGKLDACVYRCELTGTVLIHHIDDFDMCGPQDCLIDLLTVQFPGSGCKLKMGHLEFPDVGSKVSSEFLGRTKVNVEGAIITKPHERHAQTILKALGLEDCKRSPVPGKKLDLKQDQELSAAEREAYASCVGSAITLHRIAVTSSLQ